MLRFVSSDSSSYSFSLRQYFFQRFFLLDTLQGRLPPQCLAERGPACITHAACAVSPVRAAGYIVYTIHDIIHVLSVLSQWVGIILCQELLAWLQTGACFCVRIHVIEMIHSRRHYTRVLIKLYTRGHNIYMLPVAPKPVSKTPLLFQRYYLKVVKK